MINMARFLVLGNLVVKEDALALELVPGLRKRFPLHRFEEFDPSENIEGKFEEETLYIIDVVKGIRKVELLTERDLGRLAGFPKNSVHDFDIAFQLKLLANLGIVKKMVIVGIPWGMGKKEALEQVCEAIKRLEEK